MHHHSTAMVPMGHDPMAMVESYEGDVERQMEALQRLPIMEKINKAQYHSITMEECAGLFRILDLSQNGELAVEELKQLQAVPGLKLTEEDIMTLMKDCDTIGDGVVDLDEFFKVVTTGSLSFNHLLMELQGASTLKENE